MTMQPDFPQLKIELDIVPEGQNRQDRALSKDAGHTIFTYLKEQSKNQNYTIEPVYTGTLGAGNEFLVLWQFVHDNQELVIAAFGGVIALLKMIHTKIRSNKNLSCTGTTVEVLDKKIAAQGAASIDEVIVKLEEECRRQIEVKKSDGTRVSRIAETKIIIEVAKRSDNA